MINHDILQSPMKSNMKNRNKILKIVDTLLNVEVIHLHIFMLLMGNELIHHITSQGKYKLRVDLDDFGNNHRYAKYGSFHVNSSIHGYKLYIVGYSGNAGW